MAKSKWDALKDKLILIEGWARDGLTEKQIAKNLGISESTLNDYKKKHPEFLESLKKGKEIIDFEVESALLKRALGYKYEEITKERIVRKDEHGKGDLDIRIPFNSFRVYIQKLLLYVHVEYQFRISELV